MTNFSVAEKKVNKNSTSRRLQIYRYLYRNGELKLADRLAASIQTQEKDVKRRFAIFLRIGEIQEEENARQRNKQDAGP